MNPTATDREQVLATLRTANELFSQRATGASVPELNHFDPETAAVLSGHLAEAWNWVHTDGRDEETAEMVGDGFDYVSHHPAVSLIQAAMDEHADAHPEALAAKEFTPASALADMDTKAASVTAFPPVDVLLDHLLNLVKDKPPFPVPASPGAFTFALPEQCRVALVGDFGTGKPRAIRVAQAIAARAPHHVIHLGDVYPSGTRSRVQKRFIDVWNEHGPAEAKFWALNGNHEMDAKGEGYFEVLLPWCGQPGSFFSLQNQYWKLIGLDTAYEDHDLQPEQLDWLNERLSEGTSHNILLSHHQMFSAIDPRPHKNRDRLPRSVGSEVDVGRIFAWLWGHEHRFLSYARDTRFGGYLARAIGHGGKTITYDVGVHQGEDFAPRVTHYWGIRRPGTANECLNGFALFDFDGPRIKIDYVDENGTSRYTEVWPDAPLA